MQTGVQRVATVAEHAAERRRSLLTYELTHGHSIFHHLVEFINFIADLVFLSYTHTVKKKS